MPFSGGIHASRECCQTSRWQLFKKFLTLLYTHYSTLNVDYVFELPDRSSKGLLPARQRGQLALKYMKIAEGLTSDKPPWGLLQLAAPYILLPASVISTASLCEISCQSYQISCYPRQLSATQAGPLIQSFRRRGRISISVFWSGPKFLSILSMINVQFHRFIPGAPLFPWLALAGEKKILTTCHGQLLQKEKRTRKE